MKKFYIFGLMLFATTVLVAQPFLSEDFSDELMPPAGWTIDGYASNWSVANSSEAGGIAPEGKFTYSNANSITRLVSPEIDLTGQSSITLAFSHFYDHYSNPAPVLGVATRSQGGDWNMAWEINPTGNVGPQTIYVEITNSDVGNADFQFCFYLQGNFYNMDYWYVDDILLFNPLNLDGEIANITTPAYILGVNPVKGILKNTIGDTQITSAEINWQVADGDVHTTSFTGLALDRGDSYEFECDVPFDFPIGTYDLNVWISAINGVADDFPGNDLRMKNITVACFSDSRNPCFEEFTSSTCSPCATFNNSFVPWSQAHDDEITLVKYQMNWPGSGDPYYTAEGGVRRNYYGVGWVPWLQGDGMFVNTSISAVNSSFNASLANPAFTSIASTHSISGTEVTYETTVLPYADFNNYRVYIIVFEYVTTENATTNGETEFHHVMMKMIPDADGITVDFQDRVPQTFTGTVDLAGTNVEEWDDLGVAVIVQNYSRKNIQQSIYSMQDAVLATDDNLTDLTIDGTTIDGFSTDVLEYNVVLPEGTTEVPEVVGIPVDDNAKAIVVPATELPGTTTVDVFAEDLKTYKRYIINFTIAVGVEEPMAIYVHAYPNPSNGFITVKGAEGATLRVMDLSGKTVYENYNFNGNSLDLTGFENGIYLLSAELRDQSVYRTKITLVR
jgi:hypothetical protein